MCIFHACMHVIRSIKMSYSHKPVKRLTIPGLLWPGWGTKLDFSGADYISSRWCISPQYYLFSCMLALLSCSVFLRVPYIVKSAYMLVGLGIFNITFYQVFTDKFTLYDDLIK